MADSKFGLPNLKIGQIPSLGTTDTSKHNVCAETDKYKSSQSMQYNMEAHKDIMSASEYRECIRKLNPGQRQIIMYNRAWCKATVIAQKKAKLLMAIVSYSVGQVGQAKVMLYLICRDVIHFFQLIGQVEHDDPLVLLTAPTGSAAFQISGLTIHAAL